jgi:hypothetical protein
MFPCRMFLCVLLSAALLSIAACGGSNCGVVGLNVGPASATADHAASPPANGQTFSASTLFGGGGVCTQNTGVLVISNWTASDPSVHFSATRGTMVTATCTATVANPVTITATAASGTMLTGQASLTCK